MIVTTTNSVEGYRVVQYHGVVSGESINGANIFRDILAGIRDVIGGRSQSYEQIMREGRVTAINEMASEAAQLGANAVIGVSVTFGAIGANESMLMVTATGTAVTIA